MNIPKRLEGKILVGCLWLRQKLYELQNLSSCEENKIINVFTERTSTFHTSTVHWLGMLRALITRTPFSNLQWRIALQRPESQLLKRKKKELALLSRQQMYWLAKEGITKNKYSSLLEIRVIPKQVEPMMFQLLVWMLWHWAIGD